jgi:hypothetical protein
MCDIIVMIGICSGFAGISGWIFVIIAGIYNFTYMTKNKIKLSTKAFSLTLHILAIWIVTWIIFILSIIFGEATNCSWITAT